MQPKTARLVIILLVLLCVIISSVSGFVAYRKGFLAGKRHVCEIVNKSFFYNRRPVVLLGVKEQIGVFPGLENVPKTEIDDRVLEFNKKLQRDEEMNLHDAVKLWQIGESLGLLP